jgi:hypothetical protein
MVTAAGQLHVDVGIWGGAVPGNLGELRALARRRRVRVQVLPGGLRRRGVSPLDAAGLDRCLRELAGFPALLLVHAEDARSRSGGSSVNRIDWLTSNLVAIRAGRYAPARVWYHPDAHWGCSSVRQSASLARRKSGVQIPSPPPPNIPGQSVASLRRAALAACCGRTTAASASRSPAGEGLSDRPPHRRPDTMTTERSHYLAAHPGSPPTGNPRAHPASSAATRSTWPLPNHLPRRRKSKPTPRLAPQSCASLDRQIPTRADDKPVVDTAGDYADSGHPAMRLRALPPSTTSLRSDTTDTGTHGH